MASFPVMSGQRQARAGEIVSLATGQDMKAYKLCLFKRFCLWLVGWLVGWLDGVNWNSFPFTSQCQGTLARWEEGRDSS